MKKILSIIAGACMSMGLFFSCNYLDVESYYKDMLDYDSLFSTQADAEAWLWNVYSTLNGMGAEIAWPAGATAFAFASDETIFSDATDLCEKYQNGQFTAENQLNEDRWGRMYIGIRKASIFIHRIHECHEISMTERYRLQAEGRFLRAYFYWMLLKQYGPICIMPDKGQDLSLSYEQLEIARSPFDECVDYIVNELEEAASLLPLDRAQQWTGRATQGAALATRAKVLLYAASPLYNGNTDLFNLRDNEGNNLINQTPDNSKWARAAAAAKEVIDMELYELATVAASSTTAPLASGVPTADFPDGAGNIDPFESYRSCFNGEIPLSVHPEIIFARQAYGGGIQMEWIIWHSFPLSHFGLNNIAVTYKQLNAYYMRDGRDKDLSSVEFPYIDNGFTEALTNDPFVPSDTHYSLVNREPRLYASVSYNNCLWENGSAEASKQNFRVNYYRGGPDGKLLSRPYDYPLTGMTVKKYYHPDDTWDQPENYGAKFEPTIRYADVLLWYAEALNEVEGTYEFETAFGDGTITITRDVSEIQTAFSQVRYRAGLPDLSPAEYASRDEFRRKLKRERQIELFMESARYFDLRRWKDAEEEENKPITGMNVDMASTPGQKERFYDETAVLMNKVFVPKMYLWPLPFEEMKRNAKLTQNPGW